MNQVGIEAKVPGKDGAPDLTASVMVNWADNIEEAVQMFGAEAILTNAFANWRQRFYVHESVVLDPLQRVPRFP